MTLKKARDTIEMFAQVGGVVAQRSVLSVLDETIDEIRQMRDHSRRRYQNDINLYHRKPDEVDHQWDRALSWVLGEDVPA